MQNNPSTAKFSYENLFAGNVQPKVTGAEVLAKGQNLKRGSVVGITNSGELKLVNKKATDGSNEVYAVLGQDCDATDAAQTTTVYYGGEFNQNVVIVSEGEDPLDYKLSGRKAGIFFKPTVRV